MLGAALWKRQFLVFIIPFNEEDEDSGAFEINSLPWLEVYHDDVDILPAAVSLLLLIELVDFLLPPPPRIRENFLRVIYSTSSARFI